MYNHFTDVKEKSINNDLIRIQDVTTDLADTISRLNTGDNNLNNNVHHYIRTHFSLLNQLGIIKSNINGRVNNFPSTFLEKYGIDNLKNTSIAQLDEIIRKQNNRKVSTSKYKENIKKSINMKLLMQILGLILILISIYFYV